MSQPECQKVPVCCAIPWFRVAPVWQKKTVSVYFVALTLMLLSCFACAADENATLINEKNGNRSYQHSDVMYFLQGVSDNVILEQAALITEGVAGTIFTNINGVKCGLQADVNVGTSAGLNTQEHLAKFNCAGQGDVFVRRGDQLYTVIEGRECGLKIHAIAGVPDTIYTHEHVAKFDCTPGADALLFGKTKINIELNGENCGLQWDSDAGTPDTLGNKDHLAKFDCRNRGRYLTFIQASILSKASIKKPVEAVTQKN